MTIINKCFKKKLKYFISPPFFYLFGLLPYLNLRACKKFFRNYMYLAPCVFLLTSVSCSTTSQKNKNTSAKSNPNRSVAFWYDMGSSGNSSVGSALSMASASWWLQPLSSGSGGRQQHMSLLGALDSAAEEGRNINVASATAVEDMVHINIEVPTSTAKYSSPSRTVANTSPHVFVRSAQALRDSFKDSGYDLETFIRSKDMRAQVKIIPPPSSKSPVAEYRIHLIEQSVDIGGILTETGCQILGAREHCPWMVEQ